MKWLTYNNLYLFVKRDLISLNRSESRPGKVKYGMFNYSRRTLLL